MVRVLDVVRSRYDGGTRPPYMRVRVGRATRSRALGDGLRSTIGRWGRGSLDGVRGRRVLRRAGRSPVGRLRVGAGVGGSVQPAVDAERGKPRVRHGHLVGWAGGAGLAGMRDGVRSPAPAALQVVAPSGAGGQAPHAAWLLVVWCGAGMRTRSGRLRWCRSPRGSVGTMWALRMRPLAVSTVDRAVEASAVERGLGSGRGEVRLGLGRCALGRGPAGLACVARSRARSGCRRCEVVDAPAPAPAQVLVEHEASAPMASLQRFWPSAAGRLSRQERCPRHGARRSAVIVRAAMGDHAGRKIREDA
jgi:hypothetical protein